jgi:hypothetical protein
MALLMESKPKFFEGLFVRINWKSKAPFMGEIIQQKYRNFADYTGWMCKIKLEDNSNIWIRESSSRTEHENGCIPKLQK